MQQLRRHGDAQDEAQRAEAAYAGRPAFGSMRASEQAFELIARMDVAKQHGDKAKFLAAQAELKQLFEGGK